MDIDKNKERALADIRVLDLAGPIGVYCTKLLADLGADVIKVEKPDGDPTRFLGPFFHDEPGLEKSLFFFHHNTNKRGITLNIETSDGREVFKRLVKTTDVVVETFVPGYLGSIGLGYSVLRQMNPSLILTSITPFGQTGPYSQFKGSDIVGQAMGGLLNQMGWPDRAPTMAPSFGYFTASLLAANATLLAVYYRDVSGEGQHVDASMQQSVALGLETALANYDINRYIPGRGGLHYAPVSPDRGPGLRRVYRAKDGYVNCLVGIMSFEEGNLVHRWMDSHGMANELKDEKWKDVQFVREHQDKFEEVFGAFLASMTRQQILEEAHLQGVRKLFVLPVNTAEDVVNDPHLKERDFFTEVEHPELGESLTYPGRPYVLSETEWSIAHRAPLLGEHNQEIYEKELRMSRQELVVLRQAGAI